MRWRFCQSKLSLEEQILNQHSQHTEEEHLKDRLAQAEVTYVRDGGGELRQSKLSLEEQILNQRSQHTEEEHLKDRLPQAKAMYSDSTVTTAAGLMPILTEGSLQAQTVIPMAISLSFGILFATVITLFLIPCLYLLQIDGFSQMRRWRDWLSGRPASDAMSSPDGI